MADRCNETAQRFTSNLKRVFLTRQFNRIFQEHLIMVELIEPKKVYWVMNIESNKTWQSPANEARMYACFFERFKLPYMVFENWQDIKSLKPHEIY